MATRFGSHGNAFGFLRLLFASLVIVAHVPEIVDGNSTRELLTRLFGTITFGELAVDGFFIISGFLITASYLNSRTAGSYLLKRVARIYPAFIVAFLLCTFVVAPLAGGHLLDRGGRTLVNSFARMPLFGTPYVAGTFPGTHLDSLDGSVWTILYEFKCYLLVMLLGWCGLLRRPPVLAGLAVLGLAINVLMPASIDAAAMRLPDHPELWLGRLDEMGRLFGLFLAGAAFYSVREHIRIRAVPVLVASAGLIAGLCFAATAHFAVALFGTYLILAVSGIRALSGINDKDDVSYGLYLYAWPITRLLLLYIPQIGLLPLGIATWLLAWLAGWASWHLLEKPVMRRVRPARDDGATSNVVGPPNLEGPQKDPFARPVIDPQAL